MNVKSMSLLGLVVSAAVVAFPAPAPASPPKSAVNAVVAWNANAGKAAIAGCISPGADPLHESRMYAMTNLAIHDALNAIDRRSHPYAFAATVHSRTSPEAAVAAAARDVLVTLLAQIPTPPFTQACIDAGVASIEADYADALAALPDGSGKTRGIALGQAAAAAILALRAADGSDTPFLVFDYPQGTAPGVWRFTPGFDFALAPGWADVTPFVLRDSSQFRPRPPYALTTKEYTTDFNEVKRLGGDGTTTPSARTAEQTEIALFWVESSPQAWNRIARAVSADRHLVRGRARGCSACSTWRSPTATSAPSRPSSRCTTSGGRSRRFRTPTQTATRTRPRTRPGLPWCPLPRSPTTTPGTASKAALPERSSSGSWAPMTSTSRPAA